MTTFAPKFSKAADLKKEIGLIQEYAARSLEPAGASTPDPITDAANSTG